jgi:type I restriction enzyme M protein
MNTHKNSILAITETMQNESLHLTNAALVAGALASWQKLSAAGEIDQTLCIPEDAAKVPSEAATRLKHLAEAFGNTAFDMAAAALQDMHPRAASAVLGVVTLQGRQGLLKSFDPTDQVLLSANRRKLNHLPAEVCDLLIQIGQIEKRSSPVSVYLPWEPSGQLLGRALLKGADVAAEYPPTETPEPEAAIHYADLASATQGGRQHSRLREADPIGGPDFVEDGILEKFDVVIACPPFNSKPALTTQKNDPFGRFPEYSSSLTVLAIRHAMAQAKGRAIVVVSNSVLFSDGAARGLRLKLVTSGQVEAIVALPAGLLSNAGIAISVIVLRPAGSHHAIKMIDCDKANFKKADSKTRFTLDRVEDIAKLVNHELESQDVVSVDIDVIAENGWNLMPSRYVQAADMMKVEQVLSTEPMQMLGEVAEIIRPGPSTDIFDCVPALEVGAADIFDNGFVSQPSKAVEVADWRGKGQNQFLKPLDVVIVIKGSIGKVSIAPEQTPPPGPGGWVVGQSVAIVRTFGGNDPHQLVVFLRSAIGQEQIRRIAAGAAIPFLQMRELRLLRVPAKNPSTAAKAHEILERQESLRQQISELERQLKLIKYVQWERLGVSS